jgi:hypothetical protein
MRVILENSEKGPKLAERVKGESVPGLVVIARPGEGRVRNR